MTLSVIVSLSLIPQISMKVIVMQQSPVTTMYSAHMDTSYTVIKGITIDCAKSHGKKDNNIRQV